MMIEVSTCTHRGYVGSNPTLSADPLPPPTSPKSKSRFRGGVRRSTVSTDNASDFYERYRRGYDPARGHGFESTGKRYRLKAAPATPGLKITSDQVAPPPPFSKGRKIGEGFSLLFYMLSFI